MHLHEETTGTDRGHDLAPPHPATATSSGLSLAVNEFLDLFAAADPDEVHDALASGDLEQIADALAIEPPQLTVLLRELSMSFRELYIGGIPW